MPDEEQLPVSNPRHYHALEDRLREIEEETALLKIAKERAMAAGIPDGDPTGRFTGLSGMTKQLASMGVIGVLASLLTYVVVYEIPGARQKFVDALLRIEQDHREELAREHEACRGDANLWRAHAQGLAANFDRQLDQTNSRMDGLAKQIIANQIEIMFTLQLYAPKQKNKSADSKSMGFVGPPTPEEDLLTRIRNTVPELLPDPESVTPTTPDTMP